MNVPILFSNNSNEFQAFMQELKSWGLVMTVILEEMKHQSQSNLENLKEREQKRQFYNELGGNILRTYGELVNFTTRLCRQRLDTFLPTGEMEVL